MELGKLFIRITANNDEANQRLDETKQKTQDAQSKMSAALKKIGTAVAAAFTIDKIVEFGKAITEAAASVAAEQSAFEQIMGNYSDTAQQKVNEIADATGMVATRLTPYMTSMTAKFKGLGYDIDEATTLAQSGLTMAADAAAFWDMSLDESMSHLNSFVNGSYEGGEAIGLFANDTQMAMYAVEQGVVSTTSAWASLDEATKQATRLEFAQNMMQASGAVGQAAKESEQYANVQANLTEQWRQFKALIGEPFIQNIVIPAMNTLSGAVENASLKFQEAKTWVSEHRMAIELLVTVVGSLVAAILLYNTTQTIATALTVAKAAADAAGTTSLIAYAAAQAAAVAPIAATIAIITAIIAAIVLLIQHWDQIKEKVTEVAANIKEKVSSMKDSVVEKFNSLKDSVISKIDTLRSNVTEKFNSIKEKIVTPIENARDKIKSALDKVKSFFDNLKLQLPHIKLPHFSISGKLSIDPPSVPHISVSWYRKAMENAMLLNSPTIFGMAGTGQLLGGGEAGQEVVSGSDTLMSMIREAVRNEVGGSNNNFERLISILEKFLPDIAANTNSEIVLNDGVLVGRMMPKIDSKLGDILRLKGRGQ